MNKKRYEIRLGITGSPLFLLTASLDSAAAAVETYKRTVQWVKDCPFIGPVVALVDTKTQETLERYS